MDTENRKEQWIEEVLGSTRGMARANAPKNLYDKVMTGLDRPKTLAGMSFPLKQWVAAAVVLLAVNVASIAYFSAHTTQKAGEGDPLTSQVQLESTYNY